MAVTGDRTGSGPKKRFSVPPWGTFGCLRLVPVGAVGSVALSRLQLAKYPVQRLPGRRCAATGNIKTRRPPAHRVFSRWPTPQRLLHARSVHIMLVPVGATMMRRRVGACHHQVIGHDGAQVCLLWRQGEFERFSCAFSGFAPPASAPREQVSFKLSLGGQWLILFIALALFPGA